MSAPLAHHGSSCSPCARLRLAVVLVLVLATPALVTPAGAEARAWTPSERLLDLAGPWKFKPGDDPAWAAPDLADADWRQIAIPTGSGRHDARAELAWYRLEVRIGPPEGLSREQRQRLRLGVTIGKVDSAYEIFAGGQRLGGVGTMPPAPRMAYDRHGTYEVPWQAVDAGGRLVIALRVWKSPETRGDVGGPSEGRFLLGRHEQLVRRELLSELPSLFLAGLFLIVALYHLELFRRRPQLRDYLWLALTVLTFSAYTFLRSQWKYYLTDHFLVLKELEHLLIFMLLATLVQFLWPLLGLRIGPLLRACQWLASVTGVVAAATPGLALNLIVLPYLQLMVLAVISAGTWAVFSQAWRRHPEARVIAAGAVVNGAFVFNDVIVDRGFIVGPRLLPFGFAAFVLALVLSLANRFGRVHEALEELDRLYELSLDMLCVVGTDGYFKRVNPAFTQTLGFSAEELLASPLTDFIHPEDRDATRERIEGLARGEPVLDAEVRYRCRDGSYRWLSWRSISKPRRNIIYGIGRDVTEKRQAAQALERATQARAEFLANMSHEIRTPMNAIVGLSNLLLKGRLPEEERSWTQKVKASADGLLRVIDDILDFSKIEAGKLVIETVDFRLRETLDGVIALLEPRAEAQGIDLLLEVSDSVPEWLQGDPTRLRQVLLNLVGNAIKFTSEGCVVLAVEPLESGGEVFHLPASGAAFHLPASGGTFPLPASGAAFHLPASGGTLEVRFLVRDTGVGISPRVLERLFSPFTQADSSTTRQYGGTGLGLSISQRIVKLLGGEIECESTPGDGSTFRFTLPFKPARQGVREAPVIEAPANRPEQRRGYRILVAEDDEINQLVVLRVLSDLGFRAEAADNGREVLAALERESFDLVLMDCQMPVLDGYQTTRRIRRGESGGRHLPIVAVTAHALKGERERCLAAGMDDYVSKPFSEEGLAAVLDLWLGGAVVRLSPSGGTARPSPSGGTVPAAGAEITEPSAPRLRARTIRIFLRQGPGKLEAMRASLDDGDAEALASTAHGMIGNAGFMGASRLSTLCRGLEKAARRGGLAECEERLPEVEREYHRVVVVLEELLAEHSDP